MSDQNLDYAAMRRNVEKNVYREKWLYRVVFFVVHVLLYLVAMLVVWGTVVANSQLRAVLFDNGSAAGVIVIVPTVLWALVILSHIASLYIESSAGEKAIRDRLLMREVGEEILRKGLAGEGILEKPKRRAAALKAERVRLSDDGERLLGDEDEGVEQRDYATRTGHAGDS